MNSANAKDGCFADIAVDRGDLEVQENTMYGINVVGCRGTRRNFTDYARQVIHSSTYSS